MFFLKEKKIVFYGYKSLFRRKEQIFKHITEAGMEIYIIVDRNADQIPINAVTYNDFKLKVFEPKEDYAFILNFSDANMHVQVADMLYKDGFKNIIFIPFDEKYVSLKVQEMRQYFNQIVYGKITGKETIPSYDELICNERQNVIRDYGEYISFWIPVDMLHVMDSPDCKDIDSRYKVSNYGGGRAADLEYYIELYDYLYNEGQYPMRYIINKLNGRDPEEFLNNRRQLFQKLEYKIKYDWNYFIDSPIFVTYNNSAQFFTVLDGLHRTIFLIKHGYEMVPVICDKKSIAQHLGG